MFSSDVNFIYCNFPESFNTNDLYTCTNDEKCCDVGCCVYTVYKLYKFWYYWLILFIIFTFFSASSWFCKRSPENVSRHRRRIYSERCNDFHPNEHYPNCFSSYFGDVEDVVADNQIVLDQLVVSFRNRNTTDSVTFCPPPDYNTLNQKFSKDSNFYYGPPPRYSSIYKFPSLCNQQTTETPNSNNDVVNNNNEASSCDDNNVTDVQIHRENNSNNNNDNQLDETEN